MEKSGKEEVPTRFKYEKRTQFLHFSNTMQLAHGKGRRRTTWLSTVVCNSMPDRVSYSNLNRSKPVENLITFSTNLDPLSRQWNKMIPTQSTSKHTFYSPSSSSDSILEITWNAHYVPTFLCALFLCFNLFCFFLRIVCVWLERWGRVQCACASPQVEPVPRIHECECMEYVYLGECAQPNCEKRLIPFTHLNYKTLLSNRLSHPQRGPKPFTFHNLHIFPIDFIKYRRD